MAAISRKINWYPGHMDKARRKISEKLNMVDMVLELRDARIPFSSSNPQLKEMLDNQELLVVLNKKDLAQPRETKKWIEVIGKSYPAAACNSKTGKGSSEIVNKIEELGRQLAEKRREKGIAAREVRVMVVGVPNCGKSSLINSLSKRSGAKTGKKPGVTRGQQWIKVAENIKIMDTPGLLWPDIEDREQGLKLAMCGSVKPEVVDTVLLSCRLLDYLREINPSAIEKRYDVKIHGEEHSYDLMADIGRQRGCLQSGGRVDRNRAGSIVIREFQEGKLGRATLETVEDFADEED